MKQLPARPNRMRSTFNDLRLTGFKVKVFIYLWMPLLLCPAFLAPRAHAVEFYYRDFNSTSGLAFNGAATTSSCEETGGRNGDHAGDHPAYGYSDSHGREGRQPREEDDRLFRREESVSALKESFTETSAEGDAERISSEISSFSHHDEAYYGGFRNAPTDSCPVRLRLTQSKPFEVGSVWRVAGTDVLNGFETEFTLQITDLSKTCTRVKDTAFSAKLYESCVVHGADGIAFVLHADPNGTAALGNSGAGLGYEGISRSLAVEFDTWYNPEKVCLGSQDSSLNK